MNEMKRPSTLKNVLTAPAMQEQFAKALPAHLSPERFTRVAITALSRTPKLASCTQESFFRCLLDLSAMGLEPDGRRAHLIPYGNECTLILDYKGIVELMRRSGDVVSIHSDVVCHNDIFVHNLGVIEKHTFSFTEDRGDVVAVYCQVTFKDGSKQSAIMSKDEVESIRSRSRAGKSGPWVTDWNEMAKKTAVRRVSKMITLSPEIMTALESAEKTEFGPMMRRVTPQPVRLESLTGDESPTIEERFEEQDEDFWDKEDKQGGNDE